MAMGFTLDEPERVRKIALLGPAAAFTPCIYSSTCAGRPS